MYCTHCGKHIASDSKFCEYCGKAVDIGLAGEGHEQIHSSEVQHVSVERQPISVNKSFENIVSFILGFLFIVFPLLFLDITTDAFVEPKEILIILVTTILVIIFGIQTLVQGKLRLRRSPFDLPIILFTFVFLASSLLSINSYDALTAFVPLFFIVLLYFCIVNFVRSSKQLLGILTCLVSGATLAALLTIFSYVKYFPLPFVYTHMQNFTTFGSLLDQALYLIIVLPIPGYFIYSKFYTLIKSFTSHKRHNTEGQINELTMLLFTFAFVIIAIGLGLTINMLFTTQKPLILPYSAGIQIGISTITQDSGHIIKSFFLGSGFGTFLNDFTRFKPASYNTNESLWSFTFFRSSSLIWEILATTGILGLAAFLFLLYKIIREKTFFLPLLLVILAAFFLPFSFTLLALFFFILAVFAVIRIQNNPERFTDIAFNGFITIICIFILFILVGIPTYYAARFIISDKIYQQSLLYESKNNALVTYQLQASAITQFPYRDIYYRSFSQTNIAIANSLALKNTSLSNQKSQQDITTLDNQAVKAGKAAVTIAPNTSFNWSNLSSIYSDLAEINQTYAQDAIITGQQAITFDPNNPQQYNALGSIYYKIGNYDQAIQEYQKAINLKSDYADAYNNLGTVYWKKGDNNDALVEYRKAVELSPTNATYKKDLETLE